MRRTGRGVRGRRFAALSAVAAVMVGVAAGPAAGADSIREQQWHLDAMKAPEMWRTSTGTGVTVAVIDTGVKGDAPDLQGQLVSGKDFSGLPGGVTTDPNGHGTSMAANIVGSGKGLNGKGAYGLAPGAKVLPIKVNSKIGGTDGTAAGALQQLADGIVYGSDHGAKIISISQGIAAGYLKPADLEKLRAAVDHATAKGSLIFAAAGNSGSGSNVVEYPAGMPGVVGVAATDRNGKSTSESEHGPQVTLSAPGSDIYTACTGPSGYCKSHGTSDATALASASAALVWSVHPEWTNNQVLRVLINTAGKAAGETGRSDYVGYGAVRPRIALTTPGDPGPADQSPLAGASAPAPSGEATAEPGGAASAPASAPAQTPSSPAAPAPSDSGSLPLILGAAGVVVVLVVIVIVVVSRRNRSVAGPGPVPPAPYGQQPPQPQPSYPAAGFPAQPPAPGPYGQQPQAPYGQPQPYGQQPPAPGGFPPGQGTPPPSGGNPYGR